MKKCIDLRDDEHLPVSCFEHVGDPFDADMRRFAKAPEVQRRRAQGKLCFDADDLPSCEVWAPMDSVLYHN